MIKLSPRVEGLVKRSGLSYEELVEMVERSAPRTNKDGMNRRFHQWLLKVEADQILDMHLEHWTGEGRGHSFQIEEHEDCEGQGCAGCGWRGEIKRFLS